MPQPDVGAQERDATVDDDYYTGGAYYYVQAAIRSSLGGSQAGGLHLFSICIPVRASHIMATGLTYVCTQILLLPLTHLCSSFCIRALEAPGL